MMRFANLRAPHESVLKESCADFGVTPETEDLADWYIPLLAFHALLAQNFPPGHHKAAVAANIRDRLVELFQLFKAEEAR